MNAIPISPLPRALLQSTGRSRGQQLFARRSGDVIAAAADKKPPLVPTELDSWLAVSREGLVTIYFGKMDGGQGTISRSRRSWPKSSTCR